MTCTWRRWRTSVSAHSSVCRFCTAAWLPAACHPLHWPAVLAVYKLTSNIDVADVEQQVEDYTRQEVRHQLSAGTLSGCDAGKPVSSCSFQQQLLLPSRAQQVARCNGFPAAETAPRMLQHPQLALQHPPLQQQDWGRSFTAPITCSYCWLSDHPDSLKAVHNFVLMAAGCFGRGDCWPSRRASCICVSN